MSNTDAQESGKAVPPTRDLPFEYGFPVVGENDVQVLWGNQYAQVGFLTDMWADLIDGYGGEAEKFWEAFLTDYRSRDIERASAKWKGLQATGILAPTRVMLFIRRKPVTVTLYFAPQGDDLYISWRAFIQTSVSWLRIVILALAVVVLANWNSIFNYDQSFYYRDIGETQLIRTVIFGLIVFVPIFLYGLFCRGGDWLSLLRQGVHELYVDDAAALSMSVHGSIMAAADELGIDTTTLEQHEPFYLPRNRAKSRF